ncbi:MAG: nuclear transport factor 2 family protein [Mycobacterium sp.]
MSGKPEKIVRDFFAGWADPEPDELGSFSHASAVWVDGPQGVRSGAEAITAELAAQLTAVGGAAVEVKTLVSNGNTVMVEQLHTSSVGGNPVSSVVMAVFELDAEGRITQWREAYDLKSALDQIEAAVRSA